MLKIEEYLNQEKIDAFMLLQIHDELIFEVKEEIVDELSLKLKEMMESIMTLDVPLVCSVSVGDSWGELK